MARKTGAKLPASVSALARVLDQYDGRYRELRGAANFGEYMTSTQRAADEEMLIEPLLASLIEDVLGFEKGDYFLQLGKSGLKPDFTPTDLVTHRSVDWKVFQGIQTGADAYTSRIDKRLGDKERSELNHHGVGIGDPILEIPVRDKNQMPWSKHPEVLVQCPESTGILYGGVDDNFTYLVVLRKEPPKAVLDHLERYRPILATRAEITRNPRRSWWEAAWPRSLVDMSAPKVIALYRTDRGRFALDESGEWQPSIKSTIMVGRENGAPVAYLCGLLNSELLDLWYAVRGKTPWHVRRNYEPLRMNEMPYRRRTATRAPTRSPSSFVRSPQIAERSFRTDRSFAISGGSSRILGSRVRSRSIGRLSSRISGREPRSPFGSIPHSRFRARRPGKRGAKLRTSWRSDAAETRRGA